MGSLNNTNESFWVWPLRPLSWWASLSSLNSRFVICAVLFARWIISHRLTLWSRCSPQVLELLPRDFPALNQEASPDPVSLSLFRKLALRVVNSSHSAYSSFLFSPLFFQHYKLGSEQSSESIKCKLSMKVHQTFSFPLIHAQLPHIRWMLY